MSAERISPGQTVEAAADGAGSLHCAQCAVASAHQRGCQPHQVCLAPPRAPGHHPAPSPSEPQGRVPGGLSCLQPSGWAALDLLEPTEPGRPVPTRPRPPTTAGLSCVHSPVPLVPEGPHGDAVFPHEAPHGAAATLHAWLAGSGWPGAHRAALWPRAAPVGGLALRSLPSPWWEGDREALEHGEGEAPSDPHRSQPDPGPRLQPLPAERGSHTRPRGSAGKTSLSSPPARSRRWPWARGAVSHWAGRVRGVHPGPRAGPPSRGWPGTGREAAGGEGGPHLPSAPQRLQPNTRPPRPCPPQPGRGGCLPRLLEEAWVDGKQRHSRPLPRRAAARLRGSPPGGGDRVASPPLAVR